MKYVLASMLFLLAACAQQSAPETMSATISVPTIQCSMCQDTITEALTTTDGVVSASVDLDAKKVTVTFATAKLSVPQLETVITNEGYDANDKKGDPEAYADLPMCCKLPDDES